MISIQQIMSELVIDENIVGIKFLKVPKKNFSELCSYLADTVENKNARRVVCIEEEYYEEMKEFMAEEVKITEAEIHKNGEVIFEWRLTEDLTIDNKYYDGMLK